MSKKYLDYNGLSYFWGKLKAYFAAKSGEFTADHLAKVDANGNISDSGKSLSDLATSDHVHGNVTNDGKLQTTDVAIASGDKLVITDSSDGNKIARTSASFDGTSDGKALTKKGTFEDFVKPVASATNGNFAGLDANGQITDSGKNAADFKTQQTAVNDPTASGTSVTFIDTISQNANGEISATKKTVKAVTASTSGTGGNDGLMTAAMAEKLAGITAGATKVEASQTNGNIKIDGSETTVYTHPTTTAVAAAAVKVGNDANGHVVLGGALTKSDVGLGNVTNDAQVTRSEMGVANGVATLGSDGRVPSEQLPSYVDDVMEITEFANEAPVIGNKGDTCYILNDQKIYIWEDTWKQYAEPETGKIYVLLTDSTVTDRGQRVDYAANSQFRWSGNSMVKLNDGGVSEITNGEIDTIMAS